MNTLLNDYAIDLKFATEKYVAAKIEFDYYSNLQEVTKFLQSVTYPYNPFDVMSGGNTCAKGSRVFDDYAVDGLGDFDLSWVANRVSSINDSIKHIKSLKLPEFNSILTSCKEFKLEAKLQLNIELHAKFRNQN